MVYNDTEKNTNRNKLEETIFSCMCTVTKVANELSSWSLSCRYKLALAAC